MAGHTLNADESTDCIGILMMPSSFPFPDMLEGIAAGMANSSLGMRISRCEQEGDVTEQFTGELQRQRVRGMVVPMYHASQSMLDVFTHLGIPYVFVNGNAQPLSIAGQEYEAAKQITKRMLKKARGNHFLYLDVALVGNHISVAGRRSGFLDEMEASGGRAVVIDASVGHDQICEQLSGHSFDGILCYNSDVFEQVARRVMRDGVVSGCWVTDYVLEVMPVDVTYFMRVPLFEMGKRAAEELAKAIENPSYKIPAISIPYASPQTPEKAAQTSESP